LTNDQDADILRLLSCQRAWMVRLKPDATYEKAKPDAMFEKRVRV
jgi:hypothetical protein